ncbi:membrane protein [gut metagenome]|uniref:Membrane protein n=1 Tax=gut metagenome TaxID=749906 RepID=J9G5I3_9ZZZZ
MQPIGIFSRILKFAIALRVLVTTGFWPAIFVMSPRAASTSFLSLTASPTPMFNVIFVIRGTCMMDL